MFSVTIIVRVLLRVFDRKTGLNPVQVESSSSSIRGGKGEALPGGQRAATLHQDKASIPNTTHYDRIMVRRFCQRGQSEISADLGSGHTEVAELQLRMRFSRLVLPKGTTRGRSYSHSCAQGEVPRK